jgi:hypothetical protein
MRWSWALWALAGYEIVVGGSEFAVNSESTDNGFVSQIAALPSVSSAFNSLAAPIDVGVGFMLLIVAATLTSRGH